MLRLLQAGVRIAVAALIVGTILAHFGITLEALGNAFGISTDRFTELVRQGLAWTLPNLVLGLVVIIPLWFLVYILLPPRQSRE